MKKRKALRQGMFLFMASIFFVLAPLSSQAGEWKRDQIGWWYATEGGGYLKSAWVSEQGKWYYIGKDGYMRTGWILDGNTWYYLEPDGSMRTADLHENKKTYRFSTSGACRNPNGEELQEIPQTQKTADAFDGKAWEIVFFQGDLRLSFDGGEVILRNHNTDQELTTTYQYGTYTVSGNRAIFSGEIAGTYEYAELSGTGLRTRISGRDGYSSWHAAP